MGRGAPSESRCRLWQCLTLNGATSHYQWLQPKTLHRHPLDDNLSSIHQVHRGSHGTHQWTERVQNWSSCVFLPNPSFSWFKSHRKSLEHLLEEGLLLWQTPLGRHSDCFQISPDKPKNLTSSMDQSFFSRISNNSGYIKNSLSNGSKLRIYFVYFFFKLNTLKIAIIFISCFQLYIF